MAIPNGPTRTIKCHFIVYLRFYPPTMNFKDKLTRQSYDSVKGIWVNSTQPQMPKNIVKTICCQRGRGPTQREEKPPGHTTGEQSYTENQNLKLYRERKSESEREINPNFLSLSLLLLLASTGPGLEFHSWPHLQNGNFFFYFFFFFWIIASNFL